MEIVELKKFTEQALAILDEDKIFEVIDSLIENPELGKVIPHTNGLRKIRVARQGMGKRSGSRVIYYYQVEPSKIILTRCYAKSDKEDLTKQEYEQIRKDINK